MTNKGSQCSGSKPFILSPWSLGLQASFICPGYLSTTPPVADEISLDRFKIMEKRLYYGITTPGGILTTLFGLWLLTENSSAYMQMGWMHAKLGLVALLWAYHIACGYYLKCFKQNNNRKSQLFYRWFNEFPSLILVAVVILVTVKPF